MSGTSPALSEADAAAKIQSVFRGKQARADLQRSRRKEPLLRSWHWLGMALLTHGQLVYLLNLVLFPAATAEVVHWPTWRTATQWTAALAFDPVALYPSLRPDFRAHFMAMAAVVPLLLALVALLCFRPVLVVLWFFVLLASLSSICSGTALAILTNRISNLEIFFLAGGSSGLVLCAAMAAVYTFATSKQSALPLTKQLKKIYLAPVKASDTSMRNITSEHKYPPRSHAQYLCQLLVVGLLLVIWLSACEMVSMRLVAVNAWQFYAESPYYPVGKLVGWVSLVGGLWVFAHWCIILTEQGRKLLADLIHSFRSIVMKTLLLLLNVLYVPITCQLLAVLQCSSQSCDVEQQFLVKGEGPTIDSFWYSTQSSGCQKCEWLGGNCSIAKSLCPGDSDMRLSSDPSLSCSVDILPFFGPAAFLVFFVFSLGVPWVQYRLINIATAMLEAIPVAEELADHEDPWVYRTSRSRNGSIQLYNNFERPWRFSQVFITAQKLLLVLIAMLGPSEVLVTLMTMCVLHFSSVCITLYTLPFISVLEDNVNAALQVVQLLNALCATIAAWGVPLPVHVEFGLVVANFFSPFVGWLLGWLLMRCCKRQCCCVRRYTRKAETTKKYEETVQWMVAQTEQGATYWINKYTDEKTYEMPLELAERVLMEHRKAGKAADGNKEELATIVTPTHREIQKRFASADRRINRYNFRYLAYFLTVLGSICFLALTLSILGLLMSNRAAQISGPYPSVPHTQQQQAQALDWEMAQLHNWTHFVTHCCCREGKAGGYQGGLWQATRVEMWQCLNGRRKERIRADKRVGDWAIQNIRAFCSPTFMPAVQLLRGHHMEPQLDFVEQNNNNKLAVKVRHNGVSEEVLDWSSMNLW